MRCRPILFSCSSDRYLDRAGHTSTRTRPVPDAKRLPNPLPLEPLGPSSLTTGLTFKWGPKLHSRGLPGGTLSAYPTCSRQLSAVFLMTHQTIAICSPQDLWLVFLADFISDCSPLVTGPSYSGYAWLTTRGRRVIQRSKGRIAICISGVSPLSPLISCCALDVPSPLSAAYGQTVAKPLTGIT